MSTPAMTTDEQLAKTLRNTDWGRLLLRYGLEPIDAESSARRVAEKAAGELNRARWVIAQIMQSLPKKRDWLDPDIEKEAMSIINQIVR